MKLKSFGEYLCFQNMSELKSRIFLKIKFYFLYLHAFPDCYFNSFFLNYSIRFKNLFIFCFSRIYLSIFMILLFPILLLITKTSLFVLPSFLAWLKTTISFNYFFKMTLAKERFYCVFTLISYYKWTHSFIWLLLCMLSLI